MNEFVEIAASKSSLVRRKLIYGLGVNDAEYLVTGNRKDIKASCPYYSTWCNMLKRCYSLSYQRSHITYVGCTVTKEWLTFSNFRKWMETQDWKDKELDKDLLVIGNKVYSPDTCIFVVRGLNSLLKISEASRGSYKQGVCWSKWAKQFKVSCNVEGKANHLGYFHTEQEASEVYLNFKSKHIMQIALKQSDTRLRESLITYSKNLLGEQNANCF